MSLKVPHAPPSGRREAPVINFKRLYEYRFRDVDQAGRERVWAEIARYVHNRMGKPDRLLDPAAGRGEFIMTVPAAERWGVDLVSQGVALDDGVKMIISDIMAADLPDAYFDGVFLSNFLEHLNDQNAVADVLARLRQTMQPGGRIAIMGPNFKYCARQYFDCADHSVILSHIAVEEHLYAAGFELVAVYPKFLPYSFRGVLPPSPRLTKVYLGTQPLWKLLGKQFLVIARKPDHAPVGR